MNYFENNYINGGILKDIIAEFYGQRAKRIASNKDHIEKSKNVMIDWTRLDYEYNFDMLGRPIIQMPQDIVAMQELIWEVKPDLIIETGIAHGGSLILSAAMLTLLDYCDAAEEKSVLDPRMPRRKVLGIDIDIRSHNKEKILAHHMSSRIQLIEGSSVDLNVFNEIKEVASQFSKILVCLDSNHTHQHVLEELRLYTTLVSVGSYCVVFDTNIEDLPLDALNDRPWGPGNSPKTAVWEFLKNNSDFEIDDAITNKLLVTVAPDGYLKKIK